MPSVTYRIRVTLRYFPSDRYHQRYPQQRHKITPFALVRGKRITYPNRNTPPRTVDRDRSASRSSQRIPRKLMQGDFGGACSRALSL